MGLMATTSVNRTEAEPASAARLGARARLESLCDAGTFELLRCQVQPRQTRSATCYSDGVVAGIGRVAGRPVACYAQDWSFLGGSLGEVQAETIAGVMDLAARGRFPVISFIESAGARVQEGVSALQGYAAIFRRNVAMAQAVPQISVISGVAAGGGCYSPALTDFVVMTKEASMFLTGPSVVKAVAGEEIGIIELGGHQVHERNGVCHLVEVDDHSSVAGVRRLLSYLPQEVGGALPMVASIPSLGGDPSAALPKRSATVYDVRDVLAQIIDAESLLEIAPRWARSIFTGFARLGGAPVGVIANQPRYLGGVLDSESSEKGARFVEICDRFGLPLIVLVDTPGFMPGSRQERAGVIRRGAALVRAFAAATVPRVTVIMRKAFGGAYIAMNAKGLGADVVLAWPNAELGVMGAEAAIGILHRRELRSAAEPDLRRRELAAAYAEEHISVSSAARRGSVDEVIEPIETRSRLIGVVQAKMGPRSARVPSVPESWFGGIGAS